MTNAYVGPPVSRYLRSLIDNLRLAGIGGRLMVTQSCGGVIDCRVGCPQTGSNCRVRTGGRRGGCAEVGGASGYRNLITLDMGGTTAKASLIGNGRLSLAAEYEVGAAMSSRGALTGGGGYALKLPVIDISEVGAGGGSLVWLDRPERRVHHHRIAN